MQESGPLRVIVPNVAKAKDKSETEAMDMVEIEEEYSMIIEV